MPGDIVLTGTENGAYVCAFFPGRNGGSAGYARQDELTPQPSSVPLAAWNGNWRDGDNSIVLRMNGARLTASGQAYWPSAHPSPKQRPGGPNLGDMSGTATPNGNTVVFAGNDPADCRVSLTLLPPFLLAADNKRDERVVQRRVPEAIASLCRRRTVARRSDGSGIVSVFSACIVCGCQASNSRFT